MFAEQHVTIQVNDEQNTELVFPVSLVKRAEDFDALMGDVSESIEKGDDPLLYLEDHGITDPTEREILQATIGTASEAPQRGAQPHLGLLHPQFGAPRGPRQRKGGRGNRQPALAQLQQDGQHPADGA